MLDLREAVDPEDRRAVIAVAHAANAVSEPLAWYSARRMGAALRRRATWWLLREDGEPASSLVCYPLDLRLDGAPVQGYGLGAVATRPDRRGRGHASRLCAHAGERSGGPVGVLFSAIPPALYESLGFRVVPALGVACADPASLAASGPQAQLVPIDPLASLPLLRSAFDRVSDGLRVRRDDAGWVRSL